MNIFKRHRSSKQLHAQHSGRSQAARSARDRVLSDPIATFTLHTMR